VENICSFPIHRASNLLLVVSKHHIDISHPLKGLFCSQRLFFISLKADFPGSDYIIHIYSCIAVNKSKLFRCIPRIAQLVKAWICNLRIAGSSPTAGGVFFWYGPLASLSLQIASVGSDHYTKKMEVPTSGLRLKSLHGCKRATSLSSLRAAKFRRVKCKLSA